MQDYQVSSSIFSRQFCGSHSYGHEDLLEYIDQLPPSLKHNSNHNSLNKPQEQFIDKIDNNSNEIHQNIPLSDNINRTQILLNIQSFQAATMQYQPATLIDDPLKYKEMLQLICVDNHTLLIETLLHNYRSYNGFVCYLIVYSVNLQKLFIVDALSLRAYLRGDKNNQDSLNQRIFSRPSIVKIILNGDSGFKMILKEYGSILNYFCLYEQSILEDIFDFRLRPISYEIWNSLVQMAQHAINLQGKQIQEQHIIKDEIFVKQDNILAIKLNEWRHQIAKFDDESPEFVLPKNLLLYISENSSQIQHSQDLLNVCMEFHQKSNPAITQNEYFIPFFVKAYKVEISEIILENPFNPFAERQIQQEQNPKNYYFNIINQKEITFDFLEQNFGDVNDSKLKVDQNEVSLISKNQSFMDLMNILRLNQDKNTESYSNSFKSKYQNVLQDLTIELQNKNEHYKNKQNGIQKEQKNTSEAPLPQSIAEIFDISNRNRRKNKEKKKQEGSQSSHFQSRPQSASSSQAAPNAKGQGIKIQSLITYEEITDMVKNNNKSDKENGQANYKAVSQMSDQDFLKYLGWGQDSNQSQVLSPNKAQRTVMNSYGSAAKKNFGDNGPQNISGNKNGGYNQNQNNQYQSPLGGYKGQYTQCQNKQDSNQQGSRRNLIPKFQQSNQNTKSNNTYQNQNKYQYQQKNNQFAQKTYQNTQLYSQNQNENTQFNPLTFNSKQIWVPNQNIYQQK